MEHHKLYCEHCHQRTLHEAEAVEGVECWFCMVCGEETINTHKPKMMAEDKLSAA